MDHQLLPKEFVSPELALQLKELGFDEPCVFGINKENTIHAHIARSTIGEVSISWDKYDSDLPLPLVQQVLRWFRDKHGLYVRSIPEFYTEGINFNWQILWYIPKEKWKEKAKGGDIWSSDITDGTGLYGDNAEYPTQEDADLAAIEKMIEIVKNKNNG